MGRSKAVLATRKSRKGGSGLMIDCVFCDR